MKNLPINGAILYKGKRTATRLRMRHGFDDVRRENVRPIVEAIRELATAYQPLVL